MRQIDTINDGLKQRSRRRRERLAGYQAAQRCRPQRNDMRPTLIFEDRPPKSLSAAKRQVRKKDRAQIERIKASVATFGICSPVTIRGSGEIIDGHLVVQAAIELNLSDIPCIIVDHLSEDEIRVLRLTLNRLPEKGVWDFDALRLELAELIDLDAPLEVSGFSPQEIDQLILVEEPMEGDELQDDDEVAEPVCQRGDIWQAGEHLVACGDSRDPETYAALMEDNEQARLVLTDVPYNVPIKGHVTNGDHSEFAMASGEMTAEEFRQFNLAWMAACIVVLCDGAIAATFIDWRSVALIMSCWEQVGLTLLNFVVWTKSNAGQGSLWRSQHELLPVFKKGDGKHCNNVELGKHGRWRSNVWTYPGASTMGSSARQELVGHPTPKTVAMLEDALLDVTDLNDIVLDPFLGSGSMLVAAENTGRICRGIELEPKYVDLALRRWSRLTGQEPVLVRNFSADQTVEIETDNLETDEDQ